jgi:DNA-binding transcriptional ArsR family regulator
MSDLNIYTITSAIADPVRLSVMIYLMPGRATYAELQQHLDISQSNLSNHLTVLSKAGLIRKIANGRRNSYEITNPDAAQLIELLENMQRSSSKPKPTVKKIVLARTC